MAQSSDSKDKGSPADKSARREPVASVPVSTILLLREAEEGFEVFMVERNHKIDFAEGALVFPGGKTEKSDADPALAAYSRFAAGNDAESLTSAQRAVRVGGIRETFEECGVLLARPRGEADLIDGARLAEISERHRDALNANERTMLELVEQESLELAFDRLEFFAHWITPEFMPKRFDTYFFLVEAPTDHLAVHDGSESVDSLWTTVPNALALEQTGKRTIIFPTLANIKKLGRSKTVADALEAARKDEIVTVMPRLEKDENGDRIMVLPENAGYEMTRIPMEALAGRMPKGEPKT